MLDKAERDEKMLRLARERVKLPGSPLWLDYQSDVDLLVVRFSAADSTRSHGDPEAGVVYNYAGDDLVSIEILDLFGVFIC
jgi:hypothetical protein